MTTDTLAIIKSMNEKWQDKIAGNELINEKIEQWLHAAREKNGKTLHAMLAPDAYLAPPFLEEPVKGAAAVLKVLGLFARATSNFTYERVWVTDQTAILEFKAEIEGKPLHGLDLLTFDKNGSITGFEVMARPLSSIMLLRKAYENVKRPTPPG